MPDLGIIVRAHQVNDRDRLGLTHDQILRALARHENRNGRPKVGRKTYKDTTGDTAAARADRERERP